MEQAILAVINSIQIPLVTIFLKAVIVAAISMIVYNFLTLFTKYIFFRLNKHIAIGAEIKIKDELYVITEISIFRIQLENKEGILQIPITRWPIMCPKIISKNP